MEAEQSSEMEAERSSDSKSGVGWSSDLGVGWNLEQWKCEMGCPLTGVAYLFLMHIWKLHRLLKQVISN